MAGPRGYRRSPTHGGPRPHSGQYRVAVGAKSTAYALAFGSLLLLGGRLADRFGRKLIFITGLVGFGVASAVGGAATSFLMLVVARTCQGAFGALLAPAGLSLLTTTFPDQKDRGTAFGVYGAIIGSGGALGLLLGGVLTQYLSWRWCLYVNLVFDVIGTIGALLLLRHNPSREHPKVNLPSAVTISAAMFCVVYGFSNADTHGWNTASTWGFIVAGLGLLTMFVLLQSRVANPLLPLRIVLDRNRGGSYLAVFLAMAAVSGSYLFLTYYLQGTLGYSPVATGFAYMPLMAAAMVAGIVSNVVLLPRTGPKLLVVIGMLLAAIGMMWLTRIGLDSNFSSALLGPLVLMGLGLGLVIAPANNTATFRLPPADAGVGSAMANTQQQIGLSLGTALLNTMAVSATTHYVISNEKLATRPLYSQLVRLAAVHGYITAFWWAAGIFLAGAIVCGMMFRPGALAGQGDSTQVDVLLPTASRSEM